MAAGVNLTELIGANMRVNRRGVQPGVTENSLNGAESGAPVHHVGRGRMSEQMGPADNGHADLVQVASNEVAEAPG
jgi:hypothetical protein